MMRWTEAHSAPLLYASTASCIAGALLYSFVDWGAAFPLALIVLACAAAALGCVRMQLVPDVAAPFAPHVGGFVELEGLVVRAPQERERSVHFVVGVDRIGEREAVGRVLLFSEPGTDMRYGDRVVVRGELSAPEPFETETGAQFDYPGYLAAEGIGAVMFRADSEVVASGEGSHVLSALYGLKEALTEAAQRVFPEPSAGLLEGMVLGEDALPERITDAFRRSSLVHIVVLSGYNLTIVALALMWFLGLVPRMPERGRLLVGAASIVLFAAMVGFGATVVRAMLMALIALLAQALKRPKAALRALAVAAAAMVMHTPLVLVHDPSFVLSFLATFGLITLSPAMSAMLSRIPSAYGLREIASATLATQAFIMPALIFYTGTISTVSLPANLLALPLVPAAMLFGGLASGAALLSPMLALPLMLPAHALLSLIIGIAQIASELPGAVVEVGLLQTPLIFISYMALAPLALYMLRAYTPMHGDERFRLPLLRTETARIEAERARVPAA